MEFRGIPYLLFNDESLARIASGVGEPNALSPETARRETFKVAKIVVEVDLLKELPSKLISGLTSGKEFEISVTYPWLPPKCEDCAVFGHSISHCPKKPAPTKSMRKPQSRSRSRSRLRSKSNGKARDGHRSRLGRRDSARWERRKSPPLDKKIDTVEEVKDPPEDDPKSAAVLPEKENQIKHDPPIEVSAALAEVCKENPFFLVTRKKSGRKVTKTT